MAVDVSAVLPVYPDSAVVPRRTGRVLVDPSRVVNPRLGAVVDASRVVNPRMGSIVDPPRVVAPRTLDVALCCPVVAHHAVAMNDRPWLASAAVDTRRNTPVHPDDAAAGRGVAVRAIPARRVTARIASVAVAECDAEALRLCRGAECCDACAADREEGGFQKGHVRILITGRPRFCTPS